jgi:hypothetical protein
VKDLDLECKAMLFEEREYGGCMSILSLVLMFMWGCQIFIPGRKYLVEADDEGFAAVITDSDEVEPLLADMGFSAVRMPTPPN